MRCALRALRSAIRGDCGVQRQMASTDSSRRQECQPLYWQAACSALKLKAQRQRKILVNARITFSSSSHPARMRATL